MSRTETKEYQFTLTLDGAPEMTADRMDRLFDAGCDDATFGTRCGVHFAMFHRQAASPTEAIVSAIEDIERAGIGLRAIRVEPDELVTAGEIAARAGLSREAVRLYARGQRGPGGFPHPVAALHQKSPLYKWSDVAAWFDRFRTGAKHFDTTEADAIAFLNAALDIRRLAPAVPDAQRAIRRLKSKPKRVARSRG
jgi:hypothetical protein